MQRTVFQLQKKHRRRVWLIPGSGKWSLAGGMVFRKLYQQVRKIQVQKLCRQGKLRTDTLFFWHLLSGICACMHVHIQAVHSLWCMLSLHTQHRGRARTPTYTIRHIHGNGILPVMSCFFHSLDTFFFHCFQVKMAFHLLWKITFPKKIRIYFYKGKSKLFSVYCIAKMTVLLWQDGWNALPQEREEG